MSEEFESEISSTDTEEEGGDSSEEEAGEEEEEEDIVNENVMVNVSEVAKPNLQCPTKVLARPRFPCGTIRDCILQV